MRVRVGFTGADGGIDIEMDDSENFVKDLENALDAGKQIVWVDTTDGNTYGVAVAKITYVQLEGEKERLVGFA